jgi:beta-N-acetylhexosaminidase
VGSCLFLGIDETEPSPELQEFLEDLRPGGIILFARNIQEAGQVARLNAFLAGDPAHPRLLGVDQEGGRVERLRPVLGRLPSAAEVAGHGEEGVRAFGHLLGQGLRALGFQLNFAPVLDLSLPGASNLIGDRAFGVEPDRVSTLGQAYLEGLAAAGVHGVAKHFPGLGPTAEDTHVSLSRAEKDEAAFRREDLLPFVRALPSAPAVMVSHAHYPFWDPQPLPASCSPRVIQGVLRRELGYDGVAVADDLEMGAVQGAGGPQPAGLAALAAGCDQLLVCPSRSHMVAVRDGLLSALEEGALTRERLMEAARRVDGLRDAAAGLPAAPGFEQARAALKDRFGTV